MSDDAKQQPDWGNKVPCDLIPRAVFEVEITQLD
jgi:hypothetical protein